MILFGGHRREKFIVFWLDVFLFHDLIRQTPSSDCSFFFGWLYLIDQADELIEYGCTSIAGIFRSHMTHFLDILITAYP